MVSEPVQDGPVVGTPARPDDGVTHPGVLLLAGSDGARLGHGAALLESEGYTVLDCTVFGAEGRPTTLEEIELDEIDQAVAHLRENRWTSGGTIAVIGSSHGAERIAGTIVMITGAGHFSAFPYAIPALPSMCRLSPTRAFSIDFGGTPAVNAAAAQHSWALLRTELSTWASDTGNSREPGMLPGGGCA